MKTDRQKLQELMEEISEDNWCAGWLHNLEFDLWRIMNEGTQRYGKQDVTTKQIRRLKLLSDRCSGWFVFNDDVEFVYINQWRTMYHNKMANVELPLST